MLKKILNIIFPFKLPVSKRVFESWYKTVDDASRMAYLSSLPYFWLTNDSFFNRLRDTLLLLFLAYILQVAAYRLDKAKFNISHQENEKEKS